MIDETTYAALLVMVLTLTVISLVDLKTMRIPNFATALLAIAGLGYELRVRDAFGVLTGGILCFAVFWSVATLFEKLTGRVGLGFGDVKLAGAAGLWVPVYFVPVFIGFASLAALSFVLLVSLRSKEVLQSRLPFAPFMSVSLLTCWIIHVSDSAAGLLDV